MIVTVTKYKSVESVTFDNNPNECPACTAIQKFGSSEGILFLDCGGKLYRCDIYRFMGMILVSCSVTTPELADIEISRL
jgi:hypothetical protein